MISEDDETRVITVDKSTAGPITGADIQTDSDVDIINNPPGYGIHADLVDGMDVVAVERTVHNAAETIRETGRPHFVEMRTYRFRAHSMYDAERYRSKEEVKEWKERDPIVLYTNRLLEAGYVTEEDLSAIEKEAAKEIEAAVQFAEDGEWEPVEDLTRHVYARNLS